MLARAKPTEAYRQASFDARLMGASREDLVIFCIEDLLDNLGALELAEARRDPAARSRALTRGVTALTALELGVDRTAELSDSLLQFYGAAKSVLLDSIRATDLNQISLLKDDFSEVMHALKAGRRN